MSSASFQKGGQMKRLGQVPLAIALGFAVVTLGLGCGEIRTNRQLEQPVNTPLTTGVGGTLFRLNKVGDLPNAFGGRDIYGGKVDKGFAEMRLAGIEGSTLFLDVTDVNRQSTETVMDRYKPFQRNTLARVDVTNTINMESEQSQRPFRISLDTAKQRDVVISGVRITFVEVQPYSIRYTVEDLQY
jgi:hypothetical protein